jgi:hypothetical protein
MRIEQDQVDAVWQMLRDWGCLTEEGADYRTLHDLRDEFDVELEDPSKNGPGGFRHSDPNTSRKAAFDVLPRTGSQRLRALQAVAVASPGGYTYEEVEQATGISGVWKRLSELKQGGWIRVIGQRKIESTGSEGDIYALTEKGWRQYVGV